MNVWKPRGHVAAIAGSEGAEYCGAIEVNRVQGIAVISIRGPVDAHPNPYGFADYDTLFRAFVDSKDAEAIVLDLDSPGGAAAGCFEVCRAIRGLQLPPVFAVANTMAASAAYAIACIADRIVAPPSAMVGSIGVRGGHVSWAAANASFGIDVRNVSSGTLKLDGDPDAPINEDALERERASINKLAEHFFTWVSERRGFDPRSLDGACLLGEAACEAGLTDGVATLGQVLGALLTQTKEPKT